jgi:hypothetical protein
MKLKIIHRSSTIWNIIVFVLLTFFFLFAESAILKNKSGFDLQFFRSFILDQKIFLIGVLITSLSIYLHMKVSRFFLLLTTLLTIIKTTIDLYSDFDKFIITMLFFFILVAYYYLILLKTELQKAYLSPNFSTRELFDPMLYKIPCGVTADQEQLEIAIDKVIGSESYLLNWDEDSCFISCKWQDLPKNKKIKFVVEYNGYIFSQKAKIVSFKKNLGLGLVFLNERENLTFKWAEFNKIINDLGFTVGYLK